MITKEIRSIGLIVFRQHLIIIWGLIVCKLVVNKIRADMLERMNLMTSQRHESIRLIDKPVRVGETRRRTRWHKIIICSTDGKKNAGPSFGMIKPEEVINDIIIFYDKLR